MDEIEEILEEFEAFSDASDKVVDPCPIDLIIWEYVYVYFI